MSTSKLIVQKYGGATLSDPLKIKQVAQRISQLHKTQARVVVVVSAMGQTTNQLIDLANQVSPRPSLRELDMLLTVGERISMSLLSMALNDLGCPAISFTGSQAGILTDDSHVNANIIDVKAIRVDEALKENKIVILAGFQGVSQTTKEITTLGRGGSDISAVAMAAYLKADRCEILKDVSGVYTADPKMVSAAKVLPELNYNHLIEMTSWGAKVLHHSSVSLAAEKKVPLFIGAASSRNIPGTLIKTDVHFNKIYMLGVNSYSQVFNISFSDSADNFESFLEKNQIRQLRLLFKNSENVFYTGPKETLNALANFEKNQSFYKINSLNMSSVSATYSHEVSLSDLTKVADYLMKNNIRVVEKTKTLNSLHFFVTSEQKNEALELLHQLIN